MKKIILFSIALITLASVNQAMGGGVTPITTSACSGAVNICVGDTTTLNDTSVGGTWTCNNTAIATVGLTTGLLTGVTTGTAVISYTTSGGTVTTVVKVNTIPSELPITGTLTGCVGSTITLSDGTAGGEWFSSNNGIVTINSSGVVTCIGDGTVSVNYAVYNSCGINEQFAYITVGPSPVNGSTTICAGSSATLSDTTAGGTWSSSNIAIATIGSATGSLTGVAAGTCVITYTIPSGCTRTVTVTVNPVNAISSITGPTNVITGTTINLSDAVGGGIWSSASNAVATIASNGVVTGVSAGIDVVSYSVSNGCSQEILTYTVNVSNVYPITGNTSLCSGNSTALSDATPSGTWSSNNTSVATVGATSGMVTAVAAGTAVISYATAIGTVTATVTVGTGPADMPITGTMVGCVGSTIPLSDVTTGGEWFSSDNTIATISSSGVVTCVDSGVVSINYVVFNSCGINEQFARFTVQSHSPINGTTTICMAASANLTDANTGGTWSSSNTAIGTIGSTNGHLTGIAGGTCVITYTIPSGCGTTAVVSVTPHPATSPITGPVNVAIGSTIPLTDAISGGTWSSKFTSIATINSSGIVTGVSLGTDVISYSVSNSCFTSVVTYSVTVTNIVIAPITGTMAMCSGSTTALTDVTTGGTWSSSNTAVATIATSGVVTGIGAGTVVITYSVSSSFVTTTITVNQAPAMITGNTNACQGSTISLTDAVGGGVWNSSNAAIATIGSTGVVAGIMPGTTTISYNLTTCAVGTTITINIAPQAIQGLTSECAGTIITVSDATTGGTWSSSNANTSIDVSGDVTGVSAGNTIISYTLPDGCYTTYSNTVLANPSAITGTGSVCAGSVTMLTDATSGMLSYTSSNTAVATVLNSGQVTGVSTGTAIITYQITSGCITTTTVTVNSLPAAIAGSTSLCTGATITLNDITASGTWNSSNTAIAAINAASGIVTGIAGGAVIITYTTAAGCINTTTITVNVATPISGNNTVCVGSTTTLSDVAIGGTWSSSNVTIATIDLNTGVLTGLSTGTTGITYQPASGCPAIIMITVNPAATISGNTSMCPGAISNLNDAITGGTWSSSNTSIATIDASGVVTASLVNVGTATISYTTAACGVTTQPIIVNPGPQPIQGAASECIATTINLSDATTGGAWSINNSNATIDASGNVTGMNAGAATISYTLSDGCYVTYTNSIIANPANITGASPVCIGSTITLSDATTGGTWGSSNTANATVGASSGIVTGVAAGTATITYITASGCMTTTTVTVNSLPGAITGNTPVCAGSVITLVNPAGSGVWSSSNAAIATAGTTTGIITGVAGGTATITYIAGTTGCKATIIVTVNPIQPITGSTFLCMGTSATLSDASTGGTWTSSNTSIVTIGASNGLMTSVSAGSATITYTLATGCSLTTAVTIGTMSSILGATTICTGATTTLSDLTTGGTWKSSNTLLATVGSLSGTVTGAATTGTVTISYTLGTCVVTQIMTVNATPTPIQGSTSECLGITITLSDATAGGVWSANNTNVSVTGLSGSASVTGLVTGATSTITYSMVTGCYTTYANSILANPAPITGTFIVCPNAMINLTDATSGALSWTSSNTSVATVINSGQVTGVAAGTTIITYKVTSGCIATQVVTVLSKPAPINGTLTVCTGSSTLLTDTSGSGTWSSTNTGLATIGSASGIAIGVNAGLPDIIFTLASTGCKTTAILTVVGIPNAGTLSGPLTVAVGSNITLVTSGTAGGTWSASDGNATVSATGVVTGVAAGVCTITYAVSNACGFSGAYKTITITAPGGRMSGSTTTDSSNITLTSASASLLENVLNGLWNNGTAVQDKTLGVTSFTDKTVSVSLLPNPNKGTFTISGTLGNIDDEMVALEVTDMVGQVVYRNKVTAYGGKLNETILLSNKLSKGTYILNMHSKTESKIFHFVISK